MTVALPDDGKKHLSVLDTAARDPSVPPLAFRLLFCIDRQAAKSKGSTTTKALAALSGTSLPSVRHSLDRLAAPGYLTYRIGRGRLWISLAGTAPRGAAQFRRDLAVCEI